MEKMIELAKENERMRHMLLNVVFDFATRNSFDHNLANAQEQPKSIEEIMLFIGLA